MFVEAGGVEGFYFLIAKDYIYYIILSASMIWAPQYTDDC